MVQVPALVKVTVLVKLDMTHALPLEESMVNFTGLPDPPPSAVTRPPAGSAIQQWLGGRPPRGRGEPQAPRLGEKAFCPQSAAKQELPVNIGRTTL